jgi:alkanesulfonate monooxygenase SsuD/methylene tetrahydromethanopterin reductase-like flavin-dependent oxidoreductase (luciferase family)
MFSSDELSFAGDYHQFATVPVVLKPLQQPHPPLWYGIRSPETADWAATNDINIVSIATPAKMSDIAMWYRKVWEQLGKAASKLPRIGVSRHIFVVDTDAQAKSIADRAYRLWRKHFFARADRFGYKLNTQPFTRRIGPRSKRGVTDLPAPRPACGSMFGHKKPPGSTISYHG